MIQRDIDTFLNSHHESTFVFYMGVVNHWVTLVIHKRVKSDDISFYLLDSNNLDYLSKSNE